MTVLSIDSSGPAASVAISRDGELLFEEWASVGLTHSEILLPMAERALSVARLAPGDIDLFACVAGPGSFTGVRIGVCCVKGLAHGTGKPCARLNALETLAAGAPQFGGLVCPILDARRGQVYCAAFKNENGLPRRVREDAAIPLEQFLSALPADEKLYFTGDGLRFHAGRIREALGGRALIAPPQASGLRAGAACFLAEAGRGERTDAAGLLPIYLRAPQAERERAEREGAALG